MEWQHYLIVALLGSLVGIAELATRYRDAPGTLLFVPSAWFYVGLNAVASCGALYVIGVFGWSFGGTNPDAIDAYRILVAGIGAAALFRSTFFIIKVGGRDVGVGPSLILTSLLEGADRGVDRVRAKRRAQEVSAVMASVAFAEAGEALPTYCLALLQNVAPADQLALRNSVDALRSTSMLDEQKSLILGLELINIGGPGVLEAAVSALGESIRRRVPTAGKGAETPGGETSLLEKGRAKVSRSARTREHRSDTAGGVQGAAVLDESLPSAGSPPRGSGSGDAGAHGSSAPSGSSGDQPPGSESGGGPSDTEPSGGGPSDTEPSGGGGAGAVHRQPSDTEPSATEPSRDGADEDERVSRKM
jgi:hypothetical protein